MLWIICSCIDKRHTAFPSPGNRPGRLAYNRHQQAVSDHLIEENRLLKDELEGRRLWFTDKQRQ